jgi:glyoxylase-like metal-dependent hydrolase (beta-lactamase superfamily II)
VHVSAVGAPHLVDPSRLEASARRLYGESFDELWGELAPVPETNVRLVGDTTVGLDSFPAPGHASHHVAYLAPDGTLYAGDAAGVRILPSPVVLPPTPPPDLDVDAWLDTIDELERRRPERLALVHFGVVEEVGAHLDALRERLRGWRALVESGATEDEFIASAGREIETVGDELRPAYEQAMPLDQSYAGLRRYVDKRAQATA